MSALIEPANWRTGFHYPWAIGCGGSETPFTRDGKQYLYVWNSEDRQHYVYSFSEDLFILDKDFYANQ